MKKSINSKPLGRSSVELVELIKKKKSITEKLKNFFCIKFQSLIKERNYPIVNLEKEISLFLETHEKTKTIEYDFVVGKLEKQLQEAILNNHGLNSTARNTDKNNVINIYNNELSTNNNNNLKLKIVEKNSTNDKNCNGNQNNSVIYINNNNNLNDESNNNNENIFSSNEDCENNKINSEIMPIPVIHHQRSHSTNITNGLPLIFHANDKLNSLREKANDEWALIAKFNYLKQMEDDRQMKFIREEKQKKFKEGLHSQLQEKDIFKKLRQEEDMQFFLKQNDKLQIMQNEEQRKRKEKQDKLKAEKELQDKVISGI